MEKQAKNKLSTGAWVFLSVVLIVGAFFVGAFANRKVAVNDPKLLARCQAPYQQMQSSANIDLQHLAPNQDGSAAYKALSDAANGLQSCQDKYAQ